MKLSKRHRGATRLAAACLLAAVPLLASSQAIYRFVGPDGRVTFTDKPTAADPRGSVAPASSASAPAEPLGALPYELRQTASRYPVMLLSTDHCAPCNRGRALLQARGIPFSERTVTTLQDGEALKSLSQDTALPVLTIGKQQLKGFSDAEWQQYLSAAGYPLQSQLPAGYRPPPPEPLVSSKQPGTATPAEQTPPPLPPANGTANPAGIVF